MILSVIIVITDWDFLIYGKAGGSFWGKTVAYIFPAVSIVWLFVQKAGAITSCLAKSLFVKLGNISGEGFLIHELVLIYLSSIATRLFGLELSGLWLYGRALISFGLTVLSVFIWRWIQPRVLSALQGRVSRRKE